MKKLFLMTVVTLLAVFPAMAESSTIPVQPARVTAQATAVPVVVNPAANTSTLYTEVFAPGSVPVPVSGAAEMSAGVVSATAAAGVTLTVNKNMPVDILLDPSGVTKMKISWTTASDEPLTYNILRKISGEKDFSAINSEPLKVTAYVDASIKTSTAYEYKIEAKDNSENAYMSDVKTISSTGLGLPQKPYTFKTFQDVQSISIKWSMGTKGSFEISGYNLYRGKTPDALELLKFFGPQATKFNDDTVEPAIKYYYRMSTLDVAGYESLPTETEAAIPFPKPRTGLVLTSTGYRNNIYDNFGLNADFLFTYYIGSIFSDYLGANKTLKPISVILFTGDIKGTIFNEFEAWPSLGLGFTYTILLQYDLGGSDATGAGATFTSKTPITQMYGFYLAASKKLIWDNTLHAGFMSGIGSNAQTRFMAYLSPYLSDGDDGNIKQSNFAYTLGFGRPLFGKMDLKAELIVPIEANKNAFFPDYYLINTHIENFIRFDLSYFHFPGGSAVLGFINFRFSVYPNPYK